LCRQLLLWASAGSNGIGLNTLNTAAANSAGVGTAGGACSYRAEDAGGALGGPSSNSISQLQQVDHLQAHNVPGSFCNTAADLQPQQQHLPMKHDDPPGALGGPAPAPAGDHTAAAGVAGSSSHQHPALPHHQQQPGSMSTGSSSLPHRSWSSGTGAGAGAGSTPSTPAAVPVPRQQQQVSPLALAVAAAVAEHNKRQPRMWTPFALRVHQLRVAQVLLAERQRQADLNQPAPSTPSPPLQPLMPVQPTRLPALQDDEDEAEQQQQQQQQQQTGVAKPSGDGAPWVGRDQSNSQAAAPTAGSHCGGAVAGAQASFAALQVVGPGPEGQPPPLQAMPAAVPAVPAAVAVQSPPVLEMQQRLAPVAAPPHPSGGGSSSSGGASRTESPAAPVADSRTPKTAKKKWLACIAPRAL
jgi:hypothetical protein